MEVLGKLNGYMSFVNNLLLHRTVSLEGRVLSCSGVIVILYIQWCLIIGRAV
jgi:hypothetical protein